MTINYQLSCETVKCPLAPGRDNDICMGRVGTFMCAIELNKSIGHHQTGLNKANDYLNNEAHMKKKSAEEVDTDKRMAKLWKDIINGLYFTRGAIMSELEQDNEKHSGGAEIESPDDQQ